MSEDTASSLNQRTKRIRFEDTQAEESPSALSAKNAALQSISSFTMTLPKPIAPIATDISQEFLSSFIKVNWKFKSFQALEDDTERIPRTVPTMKDFDFRVNKATRKTDEFTCLKEESDGIIKEFRLAMKRQVLKCIRMEITLFRAQFQDLYINAIKALADAQMVLEKKSDDCHELISILYEFDHASLLKNIDMSDTVFAEKYKTQFELAIFPMPYGDQDMATVLQRRAKPIRNLILGCLINPIDRYMTREQEMDMEVAMKALQETVAISKKNEDVQQEMDLEPPQDESTVEEMIRDRTRQATKNLRSELGQLKKAINVLAKKSSVNLKRGQISDRGASQQKEIATSSTPSGKKKHPKSQQKKNGKGQKADGRDNDTSVGSKKQKKKKKNQRT